MWLDRDNAWSTSLTLCRRTFICRNPTEHLVFGSPHHDKYCMGTLTKRIESKRIGVCFYTRTMQEPLLRIRIAKPRRGNALMKPELRDRLRLTACAKASPSAASHAVFVSPASVAFRHPYCRCVSVRVDWPRRQRIRSLVFSSSMGAYAGRKA